MRTNRESPLNARQLIVGTLACSMANVALAGPAVSLGVPLGRSLGITLGAVLGIPLGSVLPIASGGLLTVAAVSLVIGICIVRRKKHREVEISQKR
jgi:hypothetical protein